MKKPPKVQNLRSSPKRNQIEPSSKRDLKFCERWLVHRDHNLAYAEAGFSTTSHSANAIAHTKLLRFRQYLDRRLPKVEEMVHRKIAIERADIVMEIAKIATCNALDYIEDVPVIDEKTKKVTIVQQLKPIAKLTREQAAAIDSVFVNVNNGTLGYSLPTARTRLKALTTLGEQVADFKKKDAAVHNHVHFNNIPLDKVRELKQLFLDALPAELTRAVFGRTETEAAES